MVLLVYSVLAPLTNFILAFNFLFLETMLRHQFLYVYPRIPDSGGKLWSYFIGIFLGCMLFAQITSKSLFRHVFFGKTTPSSHSVFYVSSAGAAWIEEGRNILALFPPTFGAFAAVHGFIVLLCHAGWTPHILLLAA